MLPTGVPRFLGFLVFGGVGWGGWIYLEILHLLDCNSLIASRILGIAILHFLDNFFDAEASNCNTINNPNVLDSEDNNSFSSLR